MALSEWNKFVKKIYHENKHKTGYMFKDALKDASARKGEMGKSSSCSSSSETKSKRKKRKRSSRKKSGGGKSRRRTRSRKHATENT